MDTWVHTRKPLAYSIVHDRPTHHDSIPCYPSSRGLTGTLVLPDGRWVVFTCKIPSPPPHHSSTSYLGVSTQVHPVHLAYLTPPRRRDRAERLVLRTRERRYEGRGHTPRQGRDLILGRIIPLVTVTVVSGLHRDCTGPSFVNKTLNGSGRGAGLDTTQKEQ